MFATSFRTSSYKILPMKSVYYYGYNLRYKYDLINVFNEIRHGKALWKIFLIFAIILFLIETWFGRPTLKNNRR